jgi:hypothetical protein
MEVRKANQQIIQPEISQKSEVSKTKSAVQNLIADSFEKENSQSSSSDSSSAASSEPEKKAGQITNGILIKQMTSARIGGTNAKQSSEVSGKKDLSPEEQSRVSNFDPQKENLKPSYVLQDSRSKDEDRKNSGLQPPFASNKGDANSKFTNVPRVGKDQVINTTGSEQTSNAVKDANRLVDGGTLRTQVDAEVAERHQDTNAIGGSKNDQLTDLLNPTAAGPQQSGQTHGKGSIEQVWDDKKQEVKPSKSDSSLGPGLTKFLTTGNDPTRKQTFKDAEKDFYDQDGRTEKTGKDGTVVIKDGGDVTVIKDGTKTVTHKDGSYEEYGPDGKLKDKGGPLKSYDSENYTGNVPDEVKKVEDYFKQQVASQKPQSGGETAHTDDNAVADPTVGGSVSNLYVQQGAVGLLGNPGSQDLQNGFSGGQAPVGSSQSGGNVDFGPDSDQVGYNGPTHQDDPGDVQFGSSTPVVKDAVESKNSDDDSKDSKAFTDILNLKRQKSQ